jgi:hypothetical protein
MNIFIITRGTKPPNDKLSGGGDKH